MLLSSSCRSCGNGSLRAGAKINLKPFKKQAIVSHQIITHIAVLVCYSGCLSLCGRPSIVCEHVDSGQQQATPSLLMYSGQPHVTEANVIQSELQGDFVSVPDASESRQGIQ